jgi:predicted RNase H-like HicB family nuclease
MNRFLVGFMAGIALGFVAVRHLSKAWYDHSAAMDDAPVNHFPAVAVDEAALAAVLARAHYEFYPADGLWYGEIPGFQGLWASGVTEEAARHDMRSSLIDWISFSVWKDLPLPKVPGVDLCASVRV